MEEREAMTKPFQDIGWREVQHQTTWNKLTNKIPQARSNINLD
jgi:hypothetical protein